MQPADCRNLAYDGWGPDLAIPRLERDRILAMQAWPFLYRSQPRIPGRRGSKSRPRHLPHGRRRTDVVRFEAVAGSARFQIGDGWFHSPARARQRVRIDPSCARLWTAIGGYRRLRVSFN